jgi:beta-lysine 5,6-aminomutase beta subunit
MTAELGVDRIFARGTTPADVASYLVHTLTARRAAPTPEEQAS